MKHYSILFFILCARGGWAQLPVVIKETFDLNTYGWLESETTEHKLYFHEGKYIIQAPEGGWMSLVSPYVETSKDFSLEAEFTQIDGPDNHGIGFIWGYNDKDNNHFIFSSNGYYRISTSDYTRNISADWQKTDMVKPMGEVNKLKIVQKKGGLYYYINDRLVETTTSFPWFGGYLGFVVYARMKVSVDNFVFAHDIRINLQNTKQPVGARENLGPLVNSMYDEVSPKISLDGKTLYFGRKLSPENIGGITDKEDVWETHTLDGKTWSKSANLGPPVNTTTTNNLISVSVDNNTLLFHTSEGFGFMHRTVHGWSDMEDLHISFNNESDYLEGNLSPDGKAIIFVARLKSNAFYKADSKERDIYVCVKKKDGSWSSPIHTGKVLNSAGDEYSPFLSADGRTLYFATDGRPGYGHVDVFMSKRLSDGWTQWSEPVNLGLGVNTVGFDAYYTLPAAGDYGYMVSTLKSVGLSDIIRFKVPREIRPDPVVLVVGRVLNAKTQKPLQATIRFDDLTTGKEVGEARSDPRHGDYKIVLPWGKNYGYHAASPGYISVNENLELVGASQYNEVTKDLLLIPIEVGESIQLKNVFFVISKSELKSESFPELDRLVEIMKENRTMEIELGGHTDSRGNAEDNMQLSILRVQAVKKYLVDKGIAASRITGKGYGGTRPVAPSDTEANRQLNRRVEFKITKK
jgi:outer membrane protein OmpA-like peptidoglycan-associated protein